MIRRLLYYSIKPYLPHRLRSFLRQLLARRKRKACSTSWPINPTAARPPLGWSGWHEGKTFAFVLTHDVEGPNGLAKCRMLAEVEMALGYRSSFNFIPEGEYTVPLADHTWLSENGFEVGVHDLEHDGRLFWSRRGFRRKALRINSYLRKWGAAGFRSGFMLRNLDWIHGLDIQYDSSTFDTDPFELQPDGANTIFPFWIPTPADSPKPRSSAADQRQQDDRCARTRRGYVELPYTLSQDSTLFLVLRETTPAIWRQKLDWIAAHGGMALVNVHPDYINFSGKDHTDREYPLHLYTEFLTYVSTRYSGQYWNPLPRTLATWYNGARNKPISAITSEGNNGTPVVASPRPAVRPLKGKRAAVIQFSHYPFDPRPRRAAEAMIESGMEVDLLCLSASGEQLEEVVNGVRVFRTLVNHDRGSKFTYLWNYSRFFLSSFWFLSRRSFRGRIDVVHIHNMPDVLVFAALIPKLRGAKIILDLHDPMPELMTSIKGINPTSGLIKIVKFFERRSIEFADLALTPNISFRNTFIGRGSRPEKIEIVMNSPDPEIFDPEKYAHLKMPAKNEDVFRIMHHGLIAYRHGVDILVEAVARVRVTIPGVRLDIYGPYRPFLDTVIHAARRCGIEDIVEYHGSRSQTEIAEAILRSDLGVVPNRHSHFTELNLPTRIFEYLAMHCPVVAPATLGIKDYFTPDQLPMFEPGNLDDLVAKILWVKNNPAAAAETVERGSAVYRKHLWPGEKALFVRVLTDLVEVPAVVRKKTICMVAHSFYESDNRVTRYAEALAARGDHVEVFALRRSPESNKREEINGVHIFRLQDRFGKTEKSALAYLWPLLRFLISSSLRVTWHHIRRPYDRVHIHNMPDFLVFAAWYPKLTGVKVILDIHDIVPEFYNSKFGTERNLRTFAILKWLERRSARFADHVIISNHLWLKKYADRTGMIGKCSVFINNVDSLTFHAHLRTRSDDKIIILFPGGLQWHQGLDIALRAFKRVSKELLKCEFHLYGDGNMKPSLVRLTDELGLNGKVRFFEPVRIAEIARVMANADLGVVPKRADSFGNEAYSTKIMEFMSLGVPVVVSRTEIDQFYFNDSVVRFFPSGDSDALAEAMLEVLRNDGLRRNIIANAAQYSAHNSWDTRKSDYLSLIDSLSKSQIE